MKNSRGVPLMISLPRKYRDLLRKMAGEKNIATLNEVTTASRLGREIICRYLDEINSNLSESKQLAKDNLTASSDSHCHDERKSEEREVK